MAIPAIYSDIEKVKPFFHAIKLFHARGYALQVEVSLAPPSYDYLTLATDCFQRAMAKRNIYEDDIDFAVLALQSPAFNKL